MLTQRLLPKAILLSPLPPPRSPLLPHTMRRIHSSGFFGHSSASPQATTRSYPPLFGFPGVSASTTRAEEKSARTTRTAASGAFTFKSPAENRRLAQHKRGRAPQAAPASPRRNIPSPFRSATKAIGASEIAKRDAEAKLCPGALRSCNHCRGLCFNPHDFGAGVFCSGECAISFAMLSRDPTIIPPSVNGQQQVLKVARYRSPNVARSDRTRSRSDNGSMASSFDTQAWHSVGSHEASVASGMNPSEEGDFSPHRV